MPDVLGEETWFRKAVRKGWQIVVGILIGGVLVFLYFMKPS